MIKVICLLMMMVFALFAEPDSTKTIRDSIAVLQAQKEVQELISDYITDVDVKIRNAGKLLIYSRGKIKDIRDYENSYDCPCSEYIMMNLNKTTKELDIAIDELRKAKKVLDDKIIVKDRKIKKLMTEFDERIEAK